MNEPTRRRRRRRAVAQEPEKPTGFSPIRRPYAPKDVLTDAQEEQVHQLSLRLLSEVGLKFLSEKTWPILEANGCEVDRESSMVKFPGEVIEQFLALAPRSFTMRARNPQNDLHFGGEHIHFGSASSAPNVTDLENGRRPGTQKDFENLVRINHMLDTCAFHSGHPVEPIDAPAQSRHLTSALAWHTLSDKVTRVYAIGETRVRDSLEMARIAYDLDPEELKAAPRLQAAINVNSPLLMDEALIEAAMVMAEHGQANVISPVAFAGAMSPITLSGSVVQCNAEAIAVIAFLQMVKAGAPCFYGVLTTPVDMKSGAPAMGVPETVTGTLANGQMARRYGIPQRVMQGSTSNATDAQAAYESMFSLWAAMLSGAHMVYHAHGWMEGGLTTGFEKTILDAELIGMMGALRDSIDFSDADELIDTISAVGPGGHFLGTDHTLARYKDAFHAPMLSDWRAFEFWRDDGAPDTAMRAKQKWQDMLSSYQPPPIDDAIDAKLRSFVEQRTREIGNSAI